MVEQVQKFKDQDLNHPIAAWLFMVQYRPITTVLAGLAGIAGTIGVFYLLGSIFMNVGGPYAQLPLSMVVGIGFSWDLLLEPMLLQAFLAAPIPLFAFIIFFILALFTGLSFVWSWVYQLLFKVRAGYLKGEHVSFNTMIQASFSRKWLRLTGFYLMMFGVYIGLNILSGIILYYTGLNGDFPLILNFVMTFILPILIFTRLLMTPAFILRENGKLISSVTESWNHINRWRFIKYGAISAVVIFALFMGYSTLSASLAYLPMPLLFFFLFTAGFLGILHAAFASASVGLYYRLADDFDAPVSNFGEEE